MKNKMNFNNTPIDWNKVHSVIDNSEKLLLTTHENPDGDGLGAECGLYYHLIEQDKEVRIINYSPLPSEYQYLNEDGIYEFYNSESHDEWIKDIDLVIVFDVGDFLRIRTLVDVIKKYQIKTMNIDHHPHPEQSSFNYNIVDLSAAATGSMVYDYLKVARKSAISKNSFNVMYTQNIHKDYHDLVFVQISTNSCFSVNSSVSLNA